MRLSPVVVTHTEEILKEVLRFTAPADGALSWYFRAHPRLGGRDRGMIAEAVYAILRNKSVLFHFAESGQGSMMRRLALIGLMQVASIDSLGGLSDEEVSWLTHLSKIDRASLPIEMQVNVPSWLWKKWVGQYGVDEAMRIAESLNRPAPMDVRVNSVKITREEAIRRLTELSIAIEPTPYAPLGIRIDKKLFLKNTELFKEGCIEVQDEGSQLLAQMVGAKRGEMVVDFCAGAGGKTLALGAFMRNTGRLYAFDISEKRLAKFKARLARSGLSNVHPALIAHENDSKVKRLAGKMDRVLVDAPCSGLGTLRRNPDMKWRQSLESIAELNVKQSAILAGASRLVKLGGRLIYATCSLLTEENEQIVEGFLSTHPDFVLIPAQVVLAEQKIPLEMDRYLKLMPHLHHTDGFFVAVLERRDDA